MEFAPLLGAFFLETTDMEVWQSSTAAYEKTNNKLRPRTGARAIFEPQFLVYDDQ